MPTSVEQAVQIEANKNAISTHEKVCAERYARIDASLDEGKERFDKLDARISKMERVLYVIALGVMLGPVGSAELIKKVMGV